MSLNRAGRITRGVSKLDQRRIVAPLLCVAVAARDGARGGLLRIARASRNQRHAANDDGRTERCHHW
jgi:hypothetical protein